MINWTSSEKLSLHEKPKDCSEKDPVNKHRWEKISANHISIHKGLISFTETFFGGSNWQPTPVFLPGIPWREELGRLQSTGLQESAMT